MKKLISLLLAVVMVAAFVPAIVPEVGADGALSISTYAQLKSWASNGNASQDVVLTADIVSDGTTWSPKATFSGTFDGQGHKISGLTGSQGLCTKIIGATIKNLSIVDATISAGSNSYIGAFAGKNSGNSSFINCYTNATISGTGDDYGGFLGDGTNGDGSFRFEGCWFDGNVTTDHRYISGFVGNNESRPVTFINCLATGTVKSTNADPVIAQFAGAVYSGYVTAQNCLAMGTVSVPNASFSTYAGAYAWRAYKTRAESDPANQLDSYTNCFAVTGTASHLDVEYAAGVNSNAGHVEWIAANNVLGTLAANSGYSSNWAWNFSTGVLRLVPAAFSEAPIILESGSAKVQISTYEQLLAFGAETSNDTGLTVALSADIVANDATAYQLKKTVAAGGASSLNAWHQKSSFAGTFDGQGHSIKGLFINAPSGEGGFFYNLSGTVKNVYFLEPYVNSVGGNSAVIARIGTGTSKGELSTTTTYFENVYVNGILDGTSTNIGGFVAQYGAKFKGCWFDGEINMKNNNMYSSGFVANQESRPTKFEDCLNTGKIVSTNNASGAFSGGVYNGKIYADRCVTAAYSKGLTIFFTLRSGAIAQLNDCYAVRGLYASNNGRYNDSGQSYTYTVNGVTATSDNPDEAVIIDSLDEIGDKASFESTWSLNPEGFYVPNYFASFVRSANYYISDYAELAAWGADADPNYAKTVALAADIVANSGTAAAHEASAPSNSWNVKANFRGVFDGQGHTISGLYKSGTSHLAFIDYLYGDIMNVAFIDCCFLGSAGSNAVVVSTTAGSHATIKNVFANGIVTGSVQCGGIAGLTESTTATFDTCWFDGEVRITDRYASGLVGDQRSHEVVFIDCLNTGWIFSNGSSNSDVNISGISNAIYNGTINATRVVNAGPISTSKARFSSAVFDLIQTSSHDNKDSYMTDVYAVAGLAEMVGFRYNANGDADHVNYIHGRIEEIESLDSLSAKSSFSGWKYTSDGTFVPGYFADLGLTAGAAKTFDTYEINSLSDFNSWVSSADMFAFRTVNLNCDLTVSSSYAGKDYFAGTFNGNGHTITFTSATSGLVNNAYGATFLDLTVSGDITGTTRGGFVNNAYGRTKFINCRSDVNLTGTAGANNLGGFVGQVVGHYTTSSKNGTSLSAGNYGFRLSTHNDGKSQLTFEGCWFSGIVSVNDTSGGSTDGARYVSGFVANNQSNDVIYVNSLVTGSVTTGKQSGNAPVVGGFGGATYNGYDDFTNCLFNGSISTGSFSSNTAAGAFGRIAYHASGHVYSNNYAVTQSPAILLRYNGDTASVAGKAEWIDASALGTIASSLGSAWGYRTVGGISIAVPAAFAESLDVAVYKSGATPIAPTAASKKFAGWFTDETCATVFNGTSGVAYAKFVDADIMTVKAQPRSDGDTYRIRFVSTVDCIEYTNVGFEISINGGAAKVSTSTKVYSSIIADGVTCDAAYVSGNSDSNYITYCVLKGIPNNVTGASISVKPFWTTSDGTKVYGSERLYNLTTTASSITLTAA